MKISSKEISDESLYDRLLDQSVDDLNLPLFMINILKSRYPTIRSLKNSDEKDLRNLPQIGKKRVELIQDSLVEFFAT